MEIDRIYHKDCIELMKEMPEDYIDCVITSPPYNASYRKDSYNKKYIEYDDNLPEEEYLQWIRKVFRGLKKVIKPTGTIWFNFNYTQRTQTLPYKVCLAAVDEGLMLKETLCWYKKNAAPITSEKQFTRTWEFIWLFAKSEDYKIYKQPSKEIKGQMFYKPLYNFIDTYIHMENQYSKLKISEVHHAVYPVELVKKILSFSTKEGDLVYDPFIGSGTTAVACKQMNRHYIGSDITQTYVELANQRLAQETLIRWSE